MITSGKIAVAFLAVVCVQLAVGFDTSQYTDSKQVTATYKLYWRVDQEANEIFLGYEVNTLGWFGFGIGEFSSGSMPGSDVVIIQKDSTSNEIYIQDRYTYAYAEPKKDDCETNDWTLVSGEENNGMTLIELKRSLTARDNQDRTITAGDNAIIVAWGSNEVKSISYHGSNRLATVVCFFDCDPAETEEIPNSFTLLAKMPNVTIPTAETTYMCYSAPFTTPNDADAHVVRINFIPDERSTKYVHHVVIHLCEDINGVFTTPKNCFGVDPSPLNAPGCIQMYTWARGGRAMNLPQEAGFRVKSTSVSNYYFIIDMHYNNPDGDAGQIDASGAEMIATTDLRTYDASTLTLGDPGVMLPDIPPGQSAYHVELTCPSECTENLPHDIHIFSAYFHMHTLGKTAWSWIHRGNEMIPLSRVEYYAFSNQHAVPVDIVLKPGDRINSHCVWDSSSRSKPTNVATASNDEMCMEFLTYYPAIANAPFCGYAYSGGDVTFCGNNVIQIPNPSVVDGPADINRTFGTSEGNNCVLAPSSTSPSSTAASPSSPSDVPRASSSYIIGATAALMGLVMASLLM